MNEITFTVSASRDTRKLVAVWNDPVHGGGITTQADSLDQLQREIIEAIRCHFDENELPDQARVHFQDDLSIPVLEPA